MLWPLYVFPAIPPQNHVHPLIVAGDFATTLKKIIAPFGMTLSAVSARLDSLGFFNASIDTSA
ncbi:MAG TPA: hypothetical protein VF335_09755, partial [Chitinivibrionales bacterium]